MRAWLLLLICIVAVLAPAELARRDAAVDQPTPVAPNPVAPAPKVCPGNPEWPGLTPTVQLAPRPGGYGGIQYRRTPLPPRTIALTFDDGPDPTGGPAVLDILERRCLKATFFYVGSYVALRPDLVRDAIRRGHGVASHSWSHPTRLRYWSLPAAKAEVDHGFSALRSAADGAGPVEPFFRFPGLNDSPAIRSWLSDQGISVVSAEAGADDWRGISAEAIYQRTIAYMEQEGGGVLILHETRPNMIIALPRLLDELNRRGFRFARISATDGQATAITLIGVPDASAVAQPGGEGAAGAGGTGLKR